MSDKAGPSGRSQETTAADIYAAVEELVAGGALKTAAFATVAKSCGRTTSAVTTAYYQYARTLPDGGGVRKSRRTGKVGGPSTPSIKKGDSARLAREASRVMAELVARVEELEEQARAGAAELKRLRRIIAKL